MTTGNQTAPKRTKLMLRAIALAFAAVCALTLLSQPAHAQNTYVITDGDRVVYHTTNSTDPAVILSEAGLSLSEDDTFTTSPGLVLSEITICRSLSVTIRHCGETLTVESTGESVGDLLERLNISLDGDTTVSAPLDAPVADGMVLDVSRTLRCAETYTVVIPHETTFCYDDTLPAGTELVLTPGMDGEMRCTANVVYVDGVEVSRSVMQQTVTTQPINEIVAVGTGDRDAVTASAKGPIIGDGFIITETGEVLTYTSTWVVEATAYTHTDAGCDFWTATNTHVRIGTVAVDPRYIPYGTRMFIVSNDGQYVYGVATAEDCGGAIKQDRIDLYYPTTAECFQFGRRDCTIYFLG
jgi:uncharacterized protein YabE (DUF348 family)/3D (Asp-Asp-Asp) domain-containing protein